MPEFFPAIGQLLTGSSMQSAALWTLNTVPGFPPIIQTVHILGIAVVMATLMLMNLRILGLAFPAQPLKNLTSRVLPWFWIALASNVISGAFFVLARPNRYFNNPVFAAKLTFLFAAVLLAIGFQLLMKRYPHYWEQTRKIWLDRTVALLSLALLLMVIMAGRWIAYLEYLQYPLWSMEAYDAGPQANLWLRIENWPLSQVIAATNWFPLIESIHVIAITLVVGSILWVDLRLLGLAATRLPVSTLSQQLLPWTWGAFAVSTVSGLAMFITRASAHVDNPAFRWKILLLVLAGANMAYFHFRVYKSVHEWDENIAPPRQLKIIGATSLLLWSGVMLSGRWIGHIV